MFEAEINLAFCQFPKTTKRIVHFHDNMKQFQKWNWKNLFNKEKITNYYERSLVLKNLSKNSIAIGISKDTTNYIQQNVPNLKTHYLLNAIDLNRFKPSTNNIQENSLVMIGSLIPIKGQELAIQTLFELKKRNFVFTLFLIGEGKLKSELVLLAKTLQVENQVQFLGIVNEPENILKTTKIYVHTSYSEAFGLTIIEAMACGLPVVCTDGKGNRDLIVEGENGFMIWERDVQQLADKIQYLLENEEKRLEMGKKAHAFAQQFGMEEYVRKLVGIYSE